MFFILVGRSLRILAYGADFARIAYGCLVAIHNYIEDFLGVFIFKSEKPQRSLR
jgi:hypothetical protein